ncbi:putative long-chain-fatty-acid--[acyl-carrier-protein] ligase [Medicago truncatula]|uniref:Long-chain-fatty-acid CoA ligase (AMP-forming) n=1 Tax=Medicago truncatula TaxID=3880 RepID=G7JAT4_MEDTR|nr:probable acyl-activating enzyme 16, chloroplastic [Medicago truncatula]AES71951.2 long-chain-fatty-acid CoA ligase (AMP-forming) [Medicago truncatula]RHN69183.1 putative long-chain-fatty-acid--[acyl-carrier-protein] ligase [Medicago truncatula]
MSTIPFTSKCNNYTSSTFFSYSLPLLFPRHSFTTSINLSRTRIFCQSQSKIRRFSPLLESSLLSGNDGVVSDEWKTVPDIWRSSAEKYGDKIALIDPYHDPPSTMTYKQLEDAILDFAEGLRVIGVSPNEKIALFADNSCRWLVADQGMMATGAINVVRGSRSSIEELLQIYNHSESIALAVDNPEMFNRIAKAFDLKASMRFVILLWGEKSCLVNEGSKEVPIFTFTEIMHLGRGSRRLFESHDARKHYVFEAIKSDDIATLVYTSGTTGNPKGVMLTHQNLLHQIKFYSDIVPAEVGDRFLSMLPPWHAYERACEYFIFSCGVDQVYTTVRNLKDDLERYQPHYLISVPLVYESLYSGIQRQISTSSLVRKLVALTFIRVSLGYMECKRIYEGKCLTKNQKSPSYLYAMLDWLGARIIATILFPIHMLAKKLVYSKIHSAIGFSKAGISGGGSLPSHVDRFFEAIGVTLQNGYGLTETSPVIAARRLSCNVIGSVGHPLKHTEFKVVDSETGEVLPPGYKGILKVRGPQLMKGYYKNPSATNQAIDKDGWLNTGDIGWIAAYHSSGRSRNCGGVIVVEGRAKDTIVLSSGENVEPVELEEAAMRSSLIQQIVVIGQDKRRLGAVVVPNKEVLKAARELSIIDSNSSDLSQENVTSLIYNELRTWTSEFPFQIGPILLVNDPFTIDNGLMTPTMKIRRDRIMAQYKEQIENLYK